MIPIFAQMNGLRSVAVPLTSDFDVDPERFLATQAKITYLCSPNNPTGTSLTRRSIERIVGEAPGIVIIDEAYAEFAAGNCLDLLRVSPRLLITRTLSKAFGMAGLRIGYAVGNAALVDEVEKSRGPYKVNAIAERAAVAAFAENMAWVQTLVRESIENRDRMIGALQTFGLRPLPSDANFVLVPVTGALAIDAALRQRGIAVRPFCALPDIGDALRISVAPWPMLDECLSALGEILQEQNA
jgi:histidinol-phosphate/aromatic aminotransferase/cobyric acid decarboxylase-like protein